MPSKQKLAKDSIFIEQKILKETVGSQDQVLAAHGGFNVVTFHKNGDIRLKPVTISAKRIELLQNHLMLFYTGIARTASNIAKTFVPVIKQKEKQLFAMDKMVTQAVSILNSRQDIQNFGKLLHESWSLKRSLSSSVSNSVIDDLYFTAQSAGAIGGKILGAGGGGFLLLFVPPSCRAAIIKKFHRLIHVPFRFEHDGSQIIFYDLQDNEFLQK